MPLPTWLQEPPKWLAWPLAVVGAVGACVVILKAAGFERTTSEQRMEVHKAEERGYHLARDSARRVADSTIMVFLKELEKHAEFNQDQIDSLRADNVQFKAGECVENVRTDLEKRMMITWCLRNGYQPKDGTTVN